MGTLEMPDQEATLHCVATVLSSHLIAASSRPHVPLLVSPRASNTSSSSTLSDQAGPPSVRELSAFMKRILTLAQMDAECIIMTLVYVERLLTATRGRL
ncbi:hypothetical protein PsorP6_005852 [Peronosclerospora sorghi]|uniref:Uncharacterized protein n=1 Tax=Peronosclerospora sorghi TaxID=230839 RepID=A0ACC0W2D1_9STRA|nr:hypothetical protein PsorP6_005852 [Peronosclerospora sorghi]